MSYGDGGGPWWPRWPPRSKGWSKRARCSSRCSSISSAWARVSLPSEGASDVAYALFTFPSLAAYEEYREGFGSDPDFLAADRIREESGCVRRYERSFLRPVLGGDPDA